MCIFTHSSRPAVSFTYSNKLHFQERLVRDFGVMEGEWKSTVEIPPHCPRCGSSNTKFCYYNNYSLTQPRYFCKGCRRYWTKGGSLRNVPVGGGCRKTRRSRSVRTSKNSVPSNSSCPSSNQLLEPSSSTLAQGSSSIDLALVYANFMMHQDTEPEPRPTPSSEPSNMILPDPSLSEDQLCGFELQIYPDDMGMQRAIIDNGLPPLPEWLPVDNPKNPVHFSGGIAEDDAHGMNNQLVCDLFVPFGLPSYDTSYSTGFT